jgi:hypothetical protein
MIRNQIRSNFIKISGLDFTYFLNGRVIHLNYQNRMKRLSSFFVASETGNVAIATALLIPLLAGGAGLGVETAYWYHEDLELQQAADKAVYTAAIEKRAGSNTGTILTAATTTATENGYQPGTIVVHYPPTTGAYAGDTDAIQVELTNELPRFFTGLFFTASIIENAKAVAIMQSAGNACILALSKTAGRAAQVSGLADLNLTGCTVMANSTADDAVRVQGTAKLKADCIISVGGVDLTSDATMTVCSKAITQAPPVADPFADVEVPDESGPNITNSNGATLQPGNYTNGMNLSGDVTLQPGVYVVSGGNFKVNANANVSGSGVTIYIKSGSTVSINGNATVNLSAPTSGPYSGLLFFGDRSGTGGVTLNGTASSKLTGAVYFANQDISYLGNFSGNGGCTQVVGKTVEWSGNAAITQDCTAYGMKTIATMQLIKLVE